MSGVRQERQERVRELHRAILDIARSQRPEGNITIDGERKRLHDFALGPLRITIMRAFPFDPPAHTENSSLKVLSEGRIVLSVRWSAIDYEITTFRPGDWETKLIPQDR